MPYWEYYAPRKPKPVKGGIRAQSKRGRFGKSWWAKRWNEVLEGYGLGARLGRGQSYARGGQVAALDISSGRVTARVRGGRDYEVEISIETLDGPQWESVARAMFSRPVMAASLLAGQMPDDVEDVFDEVGLSLFPRRKDLETDCTCPDWSNPCKHIAAVYLLLAEDFDRDPFLIFKLRGIERKRLLKMSGLADRAARRAGKKSPLYKAVARSSRVKPLPADPDEFWEGGGVPGDAGAGIVQARKAGGGGGQRQRARGGAARPPRKRGRPRKIGVDDRGGTGAAGGIEGMQGIVPAIPAALVKQLGSFPFWRGRRNFIESMEEIYAAASARGVRALLGEPSGD